MRMLNRTWGLAIAAVTLGVCAVVDVAEAAPTTEQSGSIVIYPKVLGTAERDTLIEISNSGNLMAHAHCFYVNSAREGEWTETDFFIWLTKQQPTHWSARSGRRFNLLDPFGSDGAGLDPGLIPPVPLGFEGQLRCVQVDDSGSPQRSNSLKGNATLLSDDDSSRYNAIVLPGNPDINVGNNDNVLELNNTDSHAGEYDACPNTLTLSAFTTGAANPIVEEFGDCTNGDCPIETQLTLTPCSADFERAQTQPVVVNLQIFNEFEEEFSVDIDVDCWFNENLSDSVFGSQFNSGVLGTLGSHARLNPADGSGAIIGVAEELHTDSDDDSGWAAFNIHFEGNRYDAARDLQGDLLSSLTCAGGSNAGNSCSGDGDCPGSDCINGVADQIVIPVIE